MGIEGIGARVARKEDKRFITGKGRYTDDVRLHGMTYASFVRSPHAHAKIKKIDVTAAKNMPGVVDVLTGQQIVDDKIGNLICGWMIHSKDGSPMKMGAWPAMAPEIVRFVGQAVAVVIAETRNQARDAAEAVEVTYEELPVAADISAAIASGAPQLHPEAPGNVIFDWTIGDEAATNDAFTKAANIVAMDITNNRLAPNAMEPRAAVAEYDTAEEHFTLYTTSQNPHVARLVLVGVLQYRAGAQAACHCAGCRRRLRLEDLHLSGRNGGAVGLQARRTPGEMDVRPHRGIPDRCARPRSSHEGRDGVRQGQQDHRPAGEDLRQSRRLHVAVLVIGADLSVRHAAVGPVQHPEHLRRGHQRLHQHHAGRCLSRRRPPGGELRDGAADGNRCAAVEGRPGRAAPEELHHQLPAPDPGDHGLRHR